MSKPNPSIRWDLPKPDIEVRPLYVFAACTLVMLSSYLTPPLLRLFSPQLRIELGLVESEWSIFTSFRSLLLIVFVLSAGILGDLLGYRRVLFVTVAGNILANTVCLVTARIGLFVVAYAMTAVFKSIIIPLNIAILLLAFPAGRTRTYSLLAFTMLSGASYLLAPLITQGLQTGPLDQLPFILPLLLGVPSLVVIVKLMPARSAQSYTRLPDVLALAVWAAAVCSLIFSLVQAGNLGWGHPLVLATLAVAAAVLILTVWYDQRPENFGLNFSLIHKQELAVAIIAGVVIHLALYAIALQLYRFFRDIQQSGWFLAGLALTPVLLGIIFLGAVVGRMTIKWSIRQNITVGLLVLAATSAGLSFLRPNASYWWLAPLLALVGLGYIMSNTPRYILLAKTVPPNLGATVQAIGSATVQLGGALAYSFMLTLIESFSRYAYGAQLRGAGLPDLEIKQKLIELELAVRTPSLVLAPMGQMAALERIAPGYKLAYTLGLSQAFLVLAFLCVAGAVAVWLGLGTNTPRLDI